MAADAATEASQAVDGPTSAVTVNRPPREVVRTLMVAMAAVLTGSAVSLACFATPQLWWRSEATTLLRINSMLVVGETLTALVGVIVVAFATPIIGRVQATAQAGAVSGSLGTGGK